MNRRKVLVAFTALLPALPLHAHTPYRQWKVYRQRYLLILSSRDDARSDELADRFATALRERLPDSRAQAARAPHVQRIASLISSKQMDVAMLSLNNARLLARGDPPFEETGVVPLRSLVQDGEHLLVCREDFPARHAYLVSEALLRNLPGVNAPEQSSDTVPVHSGTLSFLRGEPLAD
jgi:hypothetical protein